MKEKERKRKREREGETKKGRKGEKTKVLSGERVGQKGQGRKEGGPFYNCKAFAARAKRGLLKRKIKAIGRENKCE